MQVGQQGAWPTERLEGARSVRAVTLNILARQRYLYNQGGRFEPLQQKLSELIFGEHCDR